MIDTTRDSAAPSVCLITMGCAKNEVDSAAMARRLREAGFSVTEEASSADAIIVNTCSFIQAATEESIDAIFEAASLPKVDEGSAVLIVAGCMPARYGDDLAAELTEASAFVPCSREDDIAEVVARALRISLPVAAVGGEPAEGEGRTFAYVKISDGCDRFCSYCTIPYIRGRYHSFPYEQIAEDVRARTGGKTVGVAFPILSRNRFSLLLRGIAMGAEKVVLLLSYPSDEVGNHLVSLDQLDEAGIDPWHDVLSLEQFRAAFGEVVHPFTGVDYVAYYKSIIEEAGAQAEIVFANRVTAILPYTDTVITCDIHSRQRSKRLLTAAGAKVVLGLDDLLTAPVDGSGYNAPYGLLGSNKADDDRVKLFPRDAKAVAEDIGKAMSDATGKRVEAMVYGDGAFKDPAGKIWELADPVVAPGYTSGLVGTPNELKLKYLADKEFADLSGEELKNAISEKIKAKDAKKSLVGNMVSEGTTPRNLTDLIGSLCDLTSGSGDKGTPIIYIQGYFDNYTNE